ncbi:hypothetical protein ACFWN2_39305 [Lentzea sp. NPDC058436]|uniref:hypothetical protein n=1 Tax=Lentzea sp. NPDC058436 TaxID=3346499 RepID=UPI00364EC038
MNEQDLKRAFQDVVVASSPPPSMDPGIALGRAHKARSKRRASITGAVVAVLVVGVGLGSAFALNPQAAKEYMTGAGPSSSSGEPVTEWGEQWPVGQSDRTATNGPQADRAAQLLELARTSVPAGFDAPAIEYRTSGMHGGMLRGQAQVSTDKGETPEIWEYTAYVPVRKGDKIGNLTVRVTTPDPKGKSKPCSVAQGFRPDEPTDCEVVEVAGKQVGVVRSTSAGGTAAHTPGTWAGYRADNGWTVLVLQQAEYQDSGHPKLDAEPFSTQQLAELTADPKFLLGS